MPKTTPAEWLLARFTTRARAAAIYGDLLELAQTRGRFWFWTAYARTLARIRWRPSAVFLFGYLTFLTAVFAGRGTWQGPGATNSYWASTLQTALAPLWSLLPFGIDRLIFATASPLLTGIEVCSSMHRWLLERPISRNRPDSAGAAHA